MQRFLFPQQQQPMFVGGSIVHEPYGFTHQPPTEPQFFPPSYQEPQTIFVPYEQTYVGNYQDSRQRPNIRVVDNSEPQPETIFVSEREIQLEEKKKKLEEELFQKESKVDELIQKFEEQERDLKKQLSESDLSKIERKRLQDEITQLITEKNQIVKTLQESVDKKENELIFVKQTIENMKAAQLQEISRYHSHLQSNQNVIEDQKEVQRNLEGMLENEKKEKKKLKNNSKLSEFFIKSLANMRLNKIKKHEETIEKEKKQHLIDLKKKEDEHKNILKDTLKQHNKAKIDEIKEMKRKKDERHNSELDQMKDRHKEQIEALKQKHNGLFAEHTKSVKMMEEIQKIAEKHKEEKERIEKHHAVFHKYFNIDDSEVDCFFQEEEDPTHPKHYAKRVIDDAIHKLKNNIDEDCKRWDRIQKMEINLKQLNQLIHTPQNHFTNRNVYNRQLDDLVRAIKSTPGYRHIRPHLKYSPDIIYFLDQYQPQELPPHQELPPRQTRRTLFGPTKAYSGK